MFEKIKKWFYMGLWSADQVQNAAEKGVITKEQATELLGQEG